MVIQIKARHRSFSLSHSGEISFPAGVKQRPDISALLPPAAWAVRWEGFCFLSECSAALTLWHFSFQAPAQRHGGGGGGGGCESSFQSKRLICGFIGCWGRTHSHVGCVGAEPSRQDGRGSRSGYVRRILNQGKSIIVSCAATSGKNMSNLLEAAQRRAHVIQISIQLCLYSDKSEYTLSQGTLHRRWRPISSVTRAGSSGRMWSESESDLLHSGVDLEL